MPQRLVSKAQGVRAADLNEITPAPKMDPFSTLIPQGTYDERFHEPGTELSEVGQGLVSASSFVPATAILSQLGPRSTVDEQDHPPQSQASHGAFVGDFKKARGSVAMRLRMLDKSMMVSQQNRPIPKRLIKIENQDEPNAYSCSNSKSVAVGQRTAVTPHRIQQTLPASPAPLPAHL